MADVAPHAAQGPSGKSLREVSIESIQVIITVQEKPFLDNSEKQ
jgi:hypothetical protein